MKDLYKNLYRRESLRLNNWDYTWDGAYFITICTKDRIPFFACMSDDKKQLILTDIGEIAYSCWAQIPEHFPHASLDAFIIMPDHMHGIIILNNSDSSRLPTSHDLSRQDNNLSRQDNDLLPPKTEAQKRFQNPGRGSIPTILGLYKSSVSRLARKIDPNFAWQPDYYERIIRDEWGYENIREYIIKNPEKLLESGELK